MGMNSDRAYCSSAS